MRLIDGKLLADEILGEILERGQASGLWEQQLEIGALTYRDIEFANGYDKALDEVYRKTNDMPTVNAIPIEWIEQWLDRVTGTRDGDDISKYHDLVKGGILFINMLERDWEKENERRGTDKSNEDTCR